MERQFLVSELVGQAYPPAVAVEGGRLRRTWIARTSSVVPSDANLTEMQQALEEEAFSSIKEAYAATATAEALAAVRPSVHLVRLDDDHVIVRIEFAGPERTVGDAAAISQWGVLQAFDRRVRLDELQGVPSEHWFPLRAGREAEGR